MEIPLEEEHTGDLTPLDEEESSQEKQRFDPMREGKQSKIPNPKAKKWLAEKNRLRLKTAEQKL